MDAEDGPGVFTCISLGWEVKIWRMDPGFSSMGVKYGGRGIKSWDFLYISVGDEVRRRGDTPWIFFFIYCWG
jgi:hypothetical protein